MNANGLLLRDLLAGDDRRSIARSSRALARIRGNPSLVRELVALADDDDWLVSMRALDSIEKLAHQHADWINPHKQVLIRRLADSDKWEIRLQIVRAPPLFEWTPSERRRVVQILSRDANYSQAFVRAWALDGLATLARKDASLMPLVRRGLRAFEASSRPALTTRARHIRERLSIDDIPSGERSVAARSSRRHRR